MELSTLERRTLDIIFRNNGQYYWYQVDRELSRTELVNENLIKIIEKLEANNLIEIKLSDNASIKKYFITKKAIDILDIKPD